MFYVQERNGYHPKTSEAHLAALTQNEKDVIRSVIVSLTKFGNKIPNDGISDVATHITVNSYSSRPVFV